MRVVVTGATGNVGSRVVEALAADPRVSHVTGVARRLPMRGQPDVEWRAADVARSDLESLVRGADAVVHLAWRIQPSHHREELWRVNVEGTARLLDAVRRTGVGAFVHGSSVGVYSPGPKDRLVDESWPREGVRSSFYARHKAEAERRLDAAEDDDALRIVRMRPALVFQRRAATGVRRLFAGPLLPTALLSRRLLRVVPAIDGLRVQVVHAADLARAYVEAVARPVHGAFNLAADPVLDAGAAAEALGARRLPVPRRLARGLMGVSWRLHLQPSPPGWLDLGLGVPLLSSVRAEVQLGWRPTVSSVDALLELVEGMHDGAGFPTPPLDPDAGGPLRERELRSGVGTTESA